MEWAANTKPSTIRVVRSSLDNDNHSSGPSSSSSEFVETKVLPSSSVPSHVSDAIIRIQVLR